MRLRSSTASSPRHLPPPERKGELLGKTRRMVRSRWPWHRSLSSAGAVLALVLIAPPVAKAGCSHFVTSESDRARLATLTGALAPQPDRTLRSAPDAPGATTLLGILVLGTAGDPSGPLRDVRGTPGILGLVPAGAGWGRDRSLLPRRGNRSPSPRSPDEWGVPPTTPRLTRLKYRSPRVVRSGCCPAAPPRTGRAASSGWLPRHPPREPAPDARTLAQRHRPAFSGRRV